MALNRRPELVLCQEVDQLKPQSFCGRTIEISKKSYTIIPDHQDIGAIVRIGREKEEGCEKFKLFR